MVLDRDPVIDRIILDLQRKRRELDDSGSRLNTADLLRRIEALRARIQLTPSMNLKKPER